MPPSAPEAEAYKLHLTVQILFNVTEAEWMLEVMAYGQIETIPSTKFTDYTLGVKEEGGSLMLARKASLTGRAEVVRHPATDFILDKIEPNTVVVVRGAKGSGKSAAVASALFDLLKGGRQVGGLRPVVYFARPTASGREDVLYFDGHAYNLNRMGVIPIIYIAYSRITSYDICCGSREHYPYYVANFARTVSGLYSVFRMADAAVAVLEVSNDAYDLVKQEIEDLEGEAERVVEVDVDKALGGRREEFVEQVMRAHGAAEPARDAVRQIAQLDWGYAVAAALAAGEPPEKVGDSLAMLALGYITDGILNGSVEKGDVRILAGLAGGRGAADPERSFAARWLASADARNIAKMAVEYVQTKGVPPPKVVGYTVAELAEQLLKARKNSARLRV